MIGKQCLVLPKMFNNGQWRMDGHHGMEHLLNRNVQSKKVCFANMLCMLATDPTSGQLHLGPGEAQQCSKMLK